MNSKLATTLCKSKCNRRLLTTILGTRRSLVLSSSANNTTAANPTSTNTNSATPTGLSNKFESRNILQLSERNLISAIFPDKKEHFEKFVSDEAYSVYCGFDPTASSLHIGNLLALITLIHCQRRGHSPIVVIGSATALIGDPSDKTSDRNSMEVSQITSNSAQIEKLVQKVFTNHENIIWKRTHQNKLPELKILNNLKWYENMNVIKFMSLFGKQLRMGDLISRKQMENRLQSKEGINYSEFSYQVFQAYDWFYLWKNHNCTIQVLIGGSDQTGNIKTGHELINKIRSSENAKVSGPVKKKKVFSLTSPIITTDKGLKLGKSAGNAVWLDPVLFSPFELYQFFVNTPDQMVQTYLKMFTFLPLSEIDDCMDKQKKAPQTFHAQRKLAAELTLLVHGEEGLNSALKCTSALYYNDRESIAQMSQAEIETTFRGCPTTTLTMDPSMTVTDCLMNAKCFRNIEESMKATKAGGVRFNSVKSTNPQEVLIHGQHILPNNISIIRTGKKTYHLVKWVS